ncbi:MAG: four helix bundle protein [Planctomycetaceae bacterium]|jgi:four helix bundle protein|nr:four helix bundle protein [Planctomycetaceae bacterium]
MYKTNVVVEKSFDFAVRIVDLYRFLCKEHKEYVLSKQILRSGTSVGANVSEAAYGQSKKDFAAKMSVALKESSETRYWIKLLVRTNFLTQEQGNSILTDCDEIFRILHAIVKTTKNELENNRKK